MTPSVVSVNGAGLADAGHTSQSSGNVTPSGSNRAIVVHVTNSDGSPANPTSVTYDGNACTQLGTTNDVATFWKHGWYYYLNPSTSAAQATANWGANQGETLVQCVALQDVDQSTPFGTPKSTTAGNTSPVTNSAISAAIGDLVMHAVLSARGSNPDTNTIDPNSSETERIETATSGTAFDDAAIADKVAASTSESGSFKTSASSSDPDGWGVISVAIKGASGSTNANTTGTAGNGATGSLATKIAKTLSGVAATAAVGTLAAIMGQPLTGVSGAGLVGALSANLGAITANVTGVSSTGSAASLGPVLVQISLQGVDASGSPGTIIASGDANASLSGAGGSGQVGALLVTGDLSAFLVGAAGTGQVGSLSSAISKVISGNSANTSPGSVSVNLALTMEGASGTGQLGVLSVNGALAQQIAGVAGIGQAGTLTADTATYHSLSGVLADGQVGSVSITQSGSVGLIGASAMGTIGALIAQAGGILDSVHPSVSLRPMSNTAEIWKGQ